MSTQKLQLHELKIWCPELGIYSSAPLTFFCSEELVQSKVSSALTSEVSGRPIPVPSATYPVRAFAIFGGQLKKFEVFEERKTLVAKEVTA